MRLGFRSALPSDLALIVSGWSSSFRNSYTAGLIAMDDWAEVMHHQIVKVLARPGISALIAFEKDDANFVYGFAVADVNAQQERREDRVVEWPAMLYYVYVKAGYRKTGIATRLVEQIGIVTAGPYLFACQTPLGKKIVERKSPRARWNPLVARYAKET